MIVTKETAAELRLATRIYRRSHGMSQALLAKEIGVTQPTARTWCDILDKKATMPDGETLDKIVSILIGAGLVTQNGHITTKALRVRDTLLLAGVSCEPSTKCYKKKTKTSGA